MSAIGRDTMPNHQSSDGFDLERVLTLMQGDISRIKRDVSDIKTGQGHLIDVIADTTGRVVELERTQHQH